MPDDLRSSTLHDDDILLWSRRQADLLRRLQRGERVNDAIDWDNLVDEIEDVGNNALDVVEGCLQQALIRLMKVAAWPEARSVDHWLSEVAAALDRARRRCKGMTLRNEVVGSLPGLFDRARRAVLLIRQVDGMAPLPLRADACPLALDELLDPELDLREAAPRFRAG